MKFLTLASVFFATALTATDAVATSPQADPTEHKVTCPELSGEYVCSAICEYQEDGKPSKTPCTNGDYFGMDREYDEKQGVEYGYFNIKQTKEASGLTTYKFEDSRMEITAGKSLPWGSDVVDAACLHEKAFILQYVSKDYVFTGKQWLQVRTLSSQTFRKSKKGNLIVNQTTARQDHKKPDLKIVREKLVCKPRTK